jgi:hypothetical protein
MGTAIMMLMLSSCVDFFQVWAPSPEGYFEARYTHPEDNEEGNVRNVSCIRLLAAHIWDFVMSCFSMPEMVSTSINMAVTVVIFTHLYQTFLLENSD